MKTTHVATLCALALFGASASAATNWSLGSTAGSTVVDCNYRSASSGDIEINKSTNTSAGTLANGNTCRIQGRDSVTGNLTATPNDNVMVSAWATTNQVGNVTYWEDAKLTGWLGSGFGVTNRDAGAGGDAGEGSNPEHAIDNNDRIDAVLYTFTTNVALQSLTVGWRQTDSDLAVFRFVGTGVPPQLSTTTSNGLIAAGWQHVGNYADVNGTVNLGNTTGAASSWWLVTAYNPEYPGAAKNGGALNGSNDYFKLLTVSGDLKVSEPAVLALAGLGLFAAMRQRRRQAAAVTPAMA
jgi:MYXO-CTERM domain-containing protein